MNSKPSTWNPVLIFLFVMAGAIVIGLTVPGFLEMVVALGHNIPQEDLATDYVIALFWAVVLGISILAWPVPFRDRRRLVWVWLAKSVVTLGFMLLYEANYTTMDAYWYFDASRQSAFVWEGFKVGAGTQNILNLAWLQQRVIPSYHALKVSFAMVGLAGIYVFYRAATVFLQYEDSRVFYALALFPSMLFWSSILGKEPVVFLGIALYVHGLVAWYRLKGIGNLGVLALGVLVTVFIRLWLGPILLFPLVILAFRSRRRIAPKLVFIVLTAVAFLFFSNQLMHEYNIDNTRDVIATTDSASRSWATGGSGQETQVEFTSFGQMFAFMPLGAFTALFRPLPGEIMNPFGLLAGLENSVLLALLWQAIRRTRWQELRQPLVLWAIVTVVTWASVYGYISYQNLGTAVRYRFQILAPLVGLLLYLARRRDPRSCTSQTMLAKKSP